jgi:hypothetical protein
LRRPFTSGRTDAAGEVTLSTNPDFDLDKTIFKTLTSPVTRWVRRAPAVATGFALRCGARKNVRLASNPVHTR